MYNSKCTFRKYFPNKSSIHWHSVLPNSGSRTDLGVGWSRLSAGHSIARFLPVGGCEKAKEIIKYRQLRFGGAGHPKLKTFP